MRKKWRKLYNTFIELIGPSLCYKIGLKKILHSLSNE